MKTTKRSKMLLSSIAMLLVALVALGSATFAWYSINKTVSASTIKVTASKVGGLQIKGVENEDASSTTYVDAITYSTAKTVLDPAAITVNPSTGAVTAQTGTHNDGEGSVGSVTLGATTAGNNYYVVKHFTVHNTDKDSITAAPSISWTTSDNHDSFFRADLYQKISGTWTKVLDEVSAGTSANRQATLASGATSVFEQDDASGTKAVDYLLVVYADGANSNCTTTNGNAISEAEYQVAVRFG